MNCCTECFSSPYLKDIISRSKNKGSCHYCGSDNVLIYDTLNLLTIFENILELFSVDEEGELLVKQLDNIFPDKIFSRKIQDPKRKELLQDSIILDEGQYIEIFNRKVSLTCKNDKDYSDMTNPLHDSWKNFAEEIKNTNRFHIKSAIDLNKLEKLLRRYYKPIKEGEVFYRGRISDREGYAIGKMNNPPSDKTKSGRANPIGISYLYIADQLTTTLYETRATLYDYITVGEFRVKEDIEIINLRGDDYDPIPLAEKEELEDFLIHSSFISKLGNELSKPNRRNDKELDYLPTQYLSEFIKSIGFDGVEYQSSLNTKGYNIAIFNPEKFECIKVNVHEIKKIDFDHAIVK